MKIIFVAAVKRRGPMGIILLSLTFSVESLLSLGHTKSPLICLAQRVFVGMASENEKLLL